jgi:hypothetical protein
LRPLRRYRRHRSGKRSFRQSHDNRCEFGQARNLAQTSIDSIPELGIGEPCLQETADFKQPAQFYPTFHGVLEYVKYLQNERIFVVQHRKAETLPVMINRLVQPKIGLV